MAVSAERFVEGIPVNPVLPKGFYATDNETRPDSPWWNVPYITEGKRGDGSFPFAVECLDGGAWDRPTLWGCFKTEPEAVECAKLGPERRRGNPMFPDPRRVTDLPGCGLELDFQILPRATSLGGGWRLQLLAGGVEMGGGVFPADDPENNQIAFAEAEAEGQAWVSRGVPCTAPAAPAPPPQHSL